MSSSKAQAIIDRLESMDTRTADPRAGFKKIAKVLSLKSCNGCPYLKLRTRPGGDDIVALYTCEGSNAKTVITKFVMTGTKSDRCPFEQLRRMMNEAHKEIRREVNQAFTAEQLEKVEQIVHPQEPKPR